MRKSPFYEAILRVIAAVLLVAVAYVLHTAFLKPIGVHHPFLAYYPVIALAAIYLRIDGGVTAVVLSALLVAYQWIEPIGGFAVRRMEDQVYIAMFLLEGFVICYAAERARRARDARSEAAVAWEQQRAAEREVARAKERQQAAEKLREAEEWLRVALEGGRMGTWSWDMRSQCYECNDEEYDVLGLPKGEGHEQIGRFFSVVHPDDLPGLRAALNEVMDWGSEYSREFRILRPDGEVRWLAGRGHVARDAEGNPARMFGVNFDITSQKVQEEELRSKEAEARARADEFAVLMDTVPALTFIAHDPECHFMSGSRRSRRLLRVPEGASVSVSAPIDQRPTTFRCFKDGRELAPEELPLQRAAKGEEVRDFELTFLFEDGTTCDIFGDAVPVFDESGKVRGAIGAFLEISERKRMQQQLQKAHDELERRVEERTAELHNAMETLKREIEERMQTAEVLRERDQLLIHQSRLAAMGEMINNIAHQWRQPLNVLSLIVQELPVMHECGDFSDEYLNEQVEKAMELIFHMSQTIDDFRNFFRPSMEKSFFRAKDLITKTLALVSDTLMASDIRTEVDEVGEPMIYGYLSECSQVLLNVLLNARDAFLERGGENSRLIRIKAVAEGDKTVLTVTDNAGGIPERIIGKIFDPYFSTKGPEKGTGIGLFMAKNIIEKHMGGTFTVRNVDGGAEFSIVASSAAGDYPNAGTAGEPH